MPNLHAAAAVGQALCRAAGVSTLLLPRVTTLKNLADAAGGPEALPDSRRQAMLYQALRGKNWFREADLWHISAELARLFDELTRSLTQLPASAEDFAALLEQAYRARSGASLQFEARLVHELWHAMSAGTEGSMDGAVLYHLQLMQLARTADAPLYAIGLADLSPVETAFLEAYAERQPVRLFHSGDAETEDALPALLQAAWDASEAGDIRSRAAAFRSQHAVSPLRDRIALFGAHSLEQEAQAIAAKICGWLAAGKTEIAVIVQDRMVARRARALLERYDVLVDDETGWTFSTTSASAVVMRWLDALGSRFHHLDLLDLLKSPFVFADLGAAERKRAVYRLEQLIRSRGVVSHLPRYLELAKEEAEAAVLLRRLEQAQAALGRKSRPLSAWLQSLLDSLEIIGVTQGLAADIAGQQLLRLLGRLQGELAPEKAGHSQREWRQWLNQQLEAATFRDETIESPVVFTHLAACRLRRFDAVAIAGADAAHLPGQDRESVFFNQSVRAQLGLATREAALRIFRQDLGQLLTSCNEIWISWQARKNAEPNLLSPWFERLDTFHELAYGAGLSAHALPPALPAARPGQDEVGARFAANQRQPRPSLPEERVPQEISASGYNSLVACPYQYFARHALRLNELDEVRPALEKRDYGEYVHLILQRFHQRHPVLAGLDPERLTQDLQAISDEVFARAIEADYLSHAWAWRWSARIPAYIEWQLAREEEGWRWNEGELWKTLAIPLEGERTLTLKGCLDRVDAAETEQGTVHAVLDYKTQSRESLRKKLEPPGEDVQLAVYALLLGKPPAEAAFVALDGDEVREVAPAEGIADLSQAALARLKELFDHLHRGAPMPAQGTAEVCAYCEMRGLCRKDYWG